MTRPIENAKLQENSLFTIVSFPIAEFDLGFFSATADKIQDWAQRTSAAKYLRGAIVVLLSGFRVFNQN